MIDHNTEGVLIEQRDVQGLAEALVRLANDPNKRREIGFSAVEALTAGSFATTLQWILTVPLWAPIRVLCGPVALGETMIVLAKKSEPDVRLMQPLDYYKAWEASKGEQDSLVCGPRDVE